MTRELTCIVCPRGCDLTVTIEDGKVISVGGNACRRGVTYAENECTHPVRTGTSTMACENGAVVAVKDVDAAAEALNAMMPADIRKKQSQANIQKVKTEYVDSVVLDQYVDVYENVCK